MAYAGDSLSHKDGTLLSDEEINELAERNYKAREFLEKRIPCMVNTNPKRLKE